MIDVTSLKCKSRFVEHGTDLAVANRGGPVTLSQRLNRVVEANDGSPEGV